jgi:hypothetical protein
MTLLAVIHKATFMREVCSILLVSAHAYLTAVISTKNTGVTHQEPV